MTQALYRKWRPQTWDEVVGQEHVIRTLRNAVRGDRIAHAYLFAGPRGTGKTSTARVLAKAANCQAESLEDRPCNRCEPCISVNEGRFLDLVEIDAASNTSVEDVRDLREKINFSPNQGRYKVYIVDEVHMLSISAFNALLKTLEEPPSHAIFILATTEVHKIPATVLSRCQRHEFRRLSAATIRDYLASRIESEGIEVEDTALRLIARQATGSLRDAISLLDQLAASGERITYSRAQEVLGTVTRTAVRDLVGAMAESDRAAGLALINQAVNAGADPRQFARQIVDHLRELMYFRLEAGQLVEALEDERQGMRELAAKFETGDLLIAIEAFGRASFESRSSWLPGLALEMALIESTAEERLGPTRSQSAGVGGQAPPGGQAGGPSRRPKNADEAHSPGSSAPSASRSGVNTAQPGPAEAAEANARRVAPPTAEGSPNLSTPSGSVPFSQVRSHWGDILAAVYLRDPLAQALLRSGKPLGISGGALVIGFPSELLKEKMEKGQNMRALRESLAQVLDQELGLRCVILREYEEGGAEESPPVEDGGMVATAMRDFGAQVVDVGPAQEEEADEG
jgi:DNA polymerase-3 subunit gamma/tau